MHFIIMANFLRAYGVRLPIYFVVSTVIKARAMRLDIHDVFYSRIFCANFQTWS